MRVAYTEDWEEFLNGSNALKNEGYLQNSSKFIFKMGRTFGIGEWSFETWKGLKKKISLADFPFNPSKIAKTNLKRPLFLEKTISIFFPPIKLSKARCGK